MNNKRKLTTEKYDRIICALLMVMLLAICIFNGIKGGYFADYTPVNGDFQNYNVVRRFLNGQSPYKDFACYLGLGHLWLGSAAAFVIGAGKPVLQSSVMAFDFLSMAAFALSAFVILKGIFSGEKSTQKALLAANGLLLFIRLNSFYDESPFYRLLTINDDVRYVLERIGNTGNSARHLRGMAPVVFIAVYSLALWVIKKTKLKKYHQLTACAIATGSILLYSNDYGIATAVVAVIAMGVTVLFSTAGCKEKLKKYGLFAAVAAVSFVVVGCIATLGGFGSYIDYITGVGGDQAWYYLSGKSYFLYNIETDITVLVQLIVCMVYALIILFNRFSLYIMKRCGIPLFFNLTAYAAANEYRMLSGGGLMEVSNTFLWVTLAGEALSLVLFLAGKAIRSVSIRKTAAVVAALAILVCFGLETSLFISKIDSNSQKEAYMIEGIGRIINHGADLEATAERIPSDAVIFPTYASAPEAMRGTFQQTGYDYIIHALGDDAREKYLSVFSETAPDYVTTVNPALDGWEYWISNANWFFYREFYKNYVPEYAGSQFVYWKRTDSSDGLKTVDAETRITEETPGCYKIEVFTDENVTGTVDMKLDYSISKTDDRRSVLMIMSMLKIENTTSGQITETSSDREFNLPSSDCVNIPFDVVDGYGVVYAKSFPENYTYIDHMELTPQGIYTVNWEYLRTKGAQHADSVLVIGYDTINENNFIADRARELYIDGQWYTVMNRGEGQLFIQCSNAQQAAELSDYVTEYNCIKTR